MIATAPFGRTGSESTRTIINSVGDVTLLPKVLDAAERFSERPPDDAMAELMARLQLTPLFS
jgi:hypothetical protein